MNPTDLTIDLLKFHEIELLTARQAGDLLKFDPSTIYRYVRQGRLHHIRVGRCIRIRYADLQQFIAESVQG